MDVLLSLASLQILSAEIALESLKIQFQFRVQSLAEILHLMLLFATLPENEQGKPSQNEHAFSKRAPFKKAKIKDKLD